MNDGVADAVCWLCLGFTLGAGVAGRVYKRQFKKLQTDTDARFERLAADVQKERAILKELTSKVDAARDSVLNELTELADDAKH